MFSYPVQEFVGYIVFINKKSMKGGAIPAEIKLHNHHLVLMQTILDLFVCLFDSLCLSQQLGSC